MSTPLHRTLHWLFAATALCGCTVGPSYRKPSVDTPQAYRELTPADYSSTDGWKVAQPLDDRIHGKWWEMFNDTQLNALEEQVEISNQNIAAAFAGFQEARAVVRQAQSQYFPTLTTSPSITRSRTPTNFLRTGTASTLPTTPGATGTTGGTGTSSTSSATFSNSFLFPFDASWTPDLWGKVRNTVRGNKAAAQASAAELENTRLTQQAELAVDYYSLRAQDSLKQILDATVAADQKSLDLTKALFETGIDNDEAVAQADVQLKTAQAQDTNLGIARAQFEHAVALLLGKPASTFKLPAEPLTVQAPAIPLGVPSQLLERRPDVAQDERLMAQANAQIGVAKAAYFPTLTLNAGAGFESSSFSDWLTWPSRFWSVGPTIAETLFDAGLRKATVEQFQANYNQTVATYRQTVLTAFQQVEDNLASLRILSQEIEQQDAAVAAAQKFLDIATDRYKLGLDPYLDVITAQTTLLTNQQTAVQLRLQQVTASVQLIEALGGGWDATDLPSL
jgi:NodT family efflux transporter outer membrane factor (OMF) lipoprotein